MKCPNCGEPLLWKDDNTYEEHGIIGQGIIGVYLSSATKSIWMFIVFYGMFFGIGDGIGALIPMQMTWEYFPKKKGMIAGLLQGAYGLGNLLFSEISSKIVNPENQP